MRVKFSVLILLIFMATGVFAQTKTYKVLDYLKSISGKKTIAGQHSREPNSSPSKYYNQIHDKFNKWPGLWSCDFLFQADNIKDSSRWTMTHEAEKQWKNGAIVQLMFHTCPPTQEEPCGWDPGVINQLLSNTQWTDLITPGGVLYNNWLKRLDIITPYLQYLKEKGVEVLFRPLHEMNQGVFWWGGRPGPNGTARLYQITHDYLTKTKGLDNLIWVWDMQDIDRTWADYNPGAGYWDILGFDVYSGGYSQSWYDYAVSIAGDKPVAIGECSKLPTSAQLHLQPRYVFFMPWAEMVFNYNTTDEISALYNASNVITRDQMPGWKDPCSYDAEPYSIPGLIEAENFDKCGEGISFHDNDVLNSKGQYRTDSGVDIEACSEGGYDITDIQSGEWLGYTLNVDSTGIYNVEIRVSSATSGKTFHIEFAGVNVSGSISVPNTGGSQVWQTITVPVTILSSQTKQMRIVMDSDGFSINYIRFLLVNKSPYVGITSPAAGAIFEAPAQIAIAAAASDIDGTISKVEFFNGNIKLGESTSLPYTYSWTGVPVGVYTLRATAVDNGGILVTSDSLTIKVLSAQGPFGGRASDIPGKIEAENYDVGEEGIAYQDKTPGNKFNVYRPGNVDIQVCSDAGGGYSLGDFQTGEWLEYTVNIAKTGMYDIEFRLASQVSNSMISLDVDGKTVTAMVVPNTGGLQTWKTFTKKNISLTAGQKILRLNSLLELTNINWINFPIVTGLQAEENHNPEKFALYQNYPNPFNPTTKINYEIPKNCFVSIKIYDALCREVKTLLNEEKGPGYYELEFNAEDYSSGLFFCKLQAGEFVRTMKMVLIK